MLLVQSDAIQSELERIVSSREFVSSPRLVRFLRYCVEQSRAGHLDSLKESVIGVNVFDRPASYDPKADPIVRVHARRLREKLDAFYDAEGPPEVVIQVPKGGYVARFEKASPRESASHLAAAGLDLARTSGPDPSIGKLRSLPFAIAMAVVALALVVFLVRWSTERNAVPQAVQPLVSLPGSANDPAWAPNGASIAFTWDAGASQNSLAYLLKKGETVPSKLTGSHQPEYRPVWSADGTHIALLREGPANYFAIVLVDARNKTERVVRTTLRLSPMLVAPALDWSPNGEWLVTSEQPADGTAPAHLMLVSPKDGRSWVITDPPNGSTGDLEARFTPDSRRILFRRGGHGELFALSLNGTAASPPTQVTFQNSGLRGLSASKDGKTIYFGSQREDAQFGIWRIQDGDALPVRITPDGMAAVAPTIDPAGRLLVFAQPAIDVNLWLYGVQHSSEPRLLVPSTQAEYSPAFSPDGQKLAFISDRSGVAEIWISAPYGGQPRKLTSLREGDLPMWPSWSPDGTKIAFFCRREGLNYAYQTDVATGVTRLLRGGEEYALVPQYSGDGKSLYYVSNAGNRFRIWREPLVGPGAPEAVATDDIRFFRISKDRRYLYFFSFNHPEQLIQMNLATKEKRTLWTLTDSLAAFDAWDVAGNRFFYIYREPATFVPELVAVDLDGGGRRVIGPLHRLSRDWQTSIAASPDSQSVVVTQVDSDNTRLMLQRLNR